MWVHGLCGLSGSPCRCRPCYDACGKVPVRCAQQLYSALRDQRADPLHCRTRYLYRTSDLNVSKHEAQVAVTSQAEPSTTGARLGRSTARMGRAER